MELLKRTKSFHYLYLSVFFIMPFFRGFATPQNFVTNLPVSLEFEYPDRIVAGESFEIKIILKKKINYNYPGTISLVFAGGLTPGKSSVSNVHLSQKNNTLDLSWKKLPGSNIIHFPVKVNSGDMQTGVYPVNVRYTDLGGLSFSKSIGVNIYETEKPEIIEPVMSENPFTVSLVYPAEVLYHESYDLDIIISKGKNTKGSKVFLNVPPLSELTVEEYTDFQYRKKTGDLTILLNHMPASPEFTIRCKVKNTREVTSVYPIRTTVEFLNGNTISFSDFIFVTDKKNEPGSYNSQSSLRSINAVVEADTASAFEELDHLLTKWQESTGALHRLTAKSDRDTRTEKTSTKTSYESIFTGVVVFYSIQIAASEIPLINLEQKLQKKGFFEKILEDFDGSYYRYSVGDFESMDKALILKNKLVKNGYPDAFIVEYNNGMRGRSFY